MSDLAEFLLARIAEDDAVAREAQRDHYSVDGGLRWGEVGYETLPDLTIDPARVLAECEAKRRIVTYSAFMLKAWADKPSGAYPDMNRRERHTANVILDNLGVVYADHPDYRQEWRP